MIIGSSNQMGYISQHQPKLVTPKLRDGFGPSEIIGTVLNADNKQSQVHAIKELGVLALD